MQIRYLFNLVFQKFALLPFFNFLFEKQFPYFPELRYFINKIINLNTFIYQNYFIGFLNNAYVLKKEDFFDLVADFEFLYPHLFTIFSIPQTILNWQFLCFIFNDKLIYSDVLVKYIQRGQFF